VLADIIASGAVPVVWLSEVFRQAAQSRIVTNAHRINQGKMPEPGEEPGSGTWSERPGSGGCSVVTRWTSFGAMGVIRWAHVIVSPRPGRPVP
jgi:hypothetical protein